MYTGQFSQVPSELYAYDPNMQQRSQQTFYNFNQQQFNNYYNSGYNVYQHGAPMQKEIFPSERNELLRNIYPNFIYGNNPMPSNNWQVKYQDTSGWQQNFRENILMTPPPLDHFDSYVHYQYLEMLKNSHRFEDVRQLPPHYLINYLLKFLSLENSPYSFSALEYIVLCIPHFHVHLSPHQLVYLKNLLKSKYPSHINYSLQYKKLQIMDQSQTSKFVSLLQTICLFISKLEESNFSDADGVNIKYNFKQFDKNSNKQYLSWVINCLHASITHLNTLKQQQSATNTDQINDLQSNIGNTIVQLINLIQFHNTLLEQNNEYKIVDILYKIIPNTKIANVYEMGYVLDLIKIENMYGRYQIKNNHNYGYNYMHNYNYNHQINNKYELFNLFHEKLIKQLKQISNKVLRTSAKSNQNGEIKQLHKRFCFKVLNILSLRQWNQHEDLQLIKLLHGCNFICGYNLQNSGQELVKECREIIQFAIEITKEKKHGEEEVKVYENEVKLKKNDDDFW